MAKQKFQVSLRFVLLWLMPYVAAVSALLGWEPSDNLDSTVRIGAFAVLTQVWYSALVVLHYRRLFLSVKETED